MSTKRKAHNVDKKYVSELIFFPVSSGYSRWSMVWYVVVKEGGAEWQKGEPTEKGTSASEAMAAGKAGTR